MMNINLIIANNIVAKMEEKRIKQVDLANEMNLPKQTISKMLNGSRMINAGELVQIAKVLDVEIVELTALHTIKQGDNAIRAFMGKFELARPCHRRKGPGAGYHRYPDRTDGRSSGRYRLRRRRGQRKRIAS